MSKKKDKRKHQRFSISQIVDISLAHETFFAAEGVNLSQDGVLIKTKYPLEPQSKIFVMLKLGPAPDAGTIQAEGIVIHSEQNGDTYACGVQFYSLRPKDKKALDDYLASCSKGGACP
jgi:c-di-GMP-binding flagellar brake protein YcgR